MDKRTCKIFVEGLAIYLNKHKSELSQIMSNRLESQYDTCTFQCANESVTVDIKFTRIKKSRKKSK